MANRACNILVLGQTDSGKTTYTKRFLLPRAPRYLILDKFQDYTDFGEVFYTFRAVTDYIYEYLDHDFRVIFQGENDAEYEALLHWMMKAQENFMLPPLVIVLEEVQEYCDSHNLPEDINRLYRYARRWGIAVISLSQRDVGIHPTIRNGSQAIVSFKMNKTSPDLAKYYGSRIDEIYHLDPIGPPDWTPKVEENFIVHPQGLKPERLLSKTLDAGYHDG